MRMIQTDNTKYHMAKIMLRNKDLYYTQKQTKHIFSPSSLTRPA